MTIERALAETIVFVLELLFPWYSVLELEDIDSTASPFQVERNKR
jgi:hypothetical protein